MRILVGVGVVSCAALALWLLQGIYTRLDAIMATEQDLQNDLDTITSAVGTITAQVKAMADSIAAMKASGQGTVTQAQLDALDAQAKGIVADLSAIPPAA